MGRQLASGDVLRMDRRRFLQVAGTTGIALVASGRFAHVALAQSGSAPPAADAIAELAASLGHDIDGIYRFVQDEVRYEPYAGVLRGPRGTLLARAGNSADQALLLAELLRAGGRAVRYVSGPLDTATAEALMATTALDAATARELVLSGLISDADIDAGIDWERLGVPAAASAEVPDLRAFRAAALADLEAIAPGARAQLMATLEAIQGALSAAGHVVQGGASQMPPLERDEHLWVQVDDGSGWLDLDATSGGIEPGTTIASPGRATDTMPDDLRHRIDLMVTAETWIGGALVAEPILGISGFADEFERSGLSFVHLPSDSLPSIGLLGGVGGGATLYNAVFVVGPDLFVGQQPLSIGGSGGGGDLFGGALGGGGAEGLVEGESTAEWMDISVTSPGATTTTARRFIFDRVGQAARTSGAFDPSAIAPAELVALTAGGSPDYLPLRGLHAFSVASSPGNLKARIEALVPSGPAMLSAIPEAVDVMRHLLGAGLCGDLGVRPFDDTPAISSWSFQPTPQGYESGLDIWHRSGGALAIAGSETLAPPAMIMGVLPHVMERIATGDPVWTEQPAGMPVSVGAIFEAAAAQAIPLRVLSSGVPSDAGLGPEHVALLGPTLEAGYLVVIPERAVTVGGQPRLGWWIIDPVTGAAIDQREDGGGATAEKTVTDRVSEIRAQARKLIDLAREAARRDPALRDSLEFTRAVDAYLRAIAGL